MATATFIRKIPRGFSVDARLYRVDPPMPGYDENDPLTEYVVVSASSRFNSPETYIFAADAKGKVTNWLELPGSFQGRLDHAKALKGAGYEIV